MVFELDFKYEDLELAAKHVRIINTVYQYQDMMDQYIDMYRTLNKEELTQLSKLSASFKSDMPAAHPSASTLTAVYNSAMNTFPVFKELVTQIAETNKAELQMGPLKKPDRAMQKAVDDYKNDPARVIDIVRASISFPDLSSLV